METGTIHEVAIYKGKCNCTAHKIILPHDVSQKVNERNRRLS